MDALVHSPVVIALVGLAFVLYLSTTVGRRERGLPPGPPTAPFVGNAWQIPNRYAHLTFTRWAAEYGPVMSLKVLNGTMVVLSDAASVRHLLDKRSASSSDRPDAYINNDLITRNNHILLVNGPRSALFRKLFNRVLAKEAVPQHLPIQQAEGVAALYNILNRPDEFYGELRRYSASLTMCIAYGKRAPTFDQKDASGFSVQEFYAHKLRFASTLEVGAAPPFQVLPILKHLPSALSPWKPKAHELRREMEQMYVHTLFKEVQARLDKGQPRKCWLEDLAKSENNLSDEEIAWTAGAMMEGGSDTTSGTMITAILAAVLYPEALAVAQEELDRVVGPDRVPELADFDALPYCQAYISEVMRWRPVAPNGVSHLMTKDESYAGMLIPKGAIVIQNVWGILHDPSLYDRPDEFWPERFLRHEFGHKAGTDNPDFRSNQWFGAGRRICLGMHLAENSLSATIPKLLWAFKFEHAIDPSTGLKFPVSKDAFLPGHLTAPIPFRCRIQPRSETIAQTIRQEYEATLPFLESWETSPYEKNA